MCHWQGLKNICTFHFNSNIILETCIQAKQYIKKTQENERVLKLKSFLDIIDKNNLLIFKEKNVFNILHIIQYTFPKKKSNPRVI